LLLQRLDGRAGRRRTPAEAADRIVLTKAGTDKLRLASFTYSAQLLQRLLHLNEVAEVYAYYRRNEQMLANVTRDAQANPNTRKVLEPRVKHREEMRDTLAAGWEQGDKRRGTRLLYGALWMALEFQTWHTLGRQQGFDDESIELMVSMVRCLMHG
jgi:hypothetical protein